MPSPDGGDVDSTQKDFVRILSTIESNLSSEEPLKLLDDLCKVAKRLQRKDPKYRTLDLRNPVVQERLLHVEGVDAYLAYLGFEETDNGKLVCPDDQPPRSVIMTAQQCCKDFIREWKSRDRVLRLLSESSKNLLKAQKEKEKEQEQKEQKEEAEQEQDEEEEEEEKSVS